VRALRYHRRQQARLRLALGQPATVPLRWVEPGRSPHPIELDLVFRTERGTPVNPNHASRAFARLAASVGLAAHPHLLRHALASAMAANKEPASIIAAQLRHADGGALAQRVYIHQLPQTAPRLAGVIEGVFGPAARDARRCRRGVGRRESGGKPNPAGRPDGLRSNHVSAAQGGCGRDRIRTCVGNAGDFTGRTAITPPVPSRPHMVPVIACDVHKRPVDSFRRPSASPPVPARLAQSSVGRRESGGKAPPTPGFAFRTDVVSGLNL
jgi:integrase-like protein